MLDERRVRRRSDGHGLLDQAVEQLSAMAHGAAVEPEREFVQVVVQMGSRHRPLMRAEQPRRQRRARTLKDGAGRHRRLPATRRALELRAYRPRFAGTAFGDTETRPATAAAPGTFGTLRPWRTDARTRSPCEDNPPRARTLPVVVTLAKGIPQPRCSCSMTTATAWPRSCDRATCTAPTTGTSC